MATLQTLYSVPLRKSDIDLITYALRCLMQDASIVTTQIDAMELLSYIEQQKKELINNL